jgi:hypothetical protein
MSQTWIGAALAVLALSPLAWADHKLPVFNLRAECRAIDSTFPDQKCSADEQAARLTLESGWLGFADQDRGNCIGEATAGGGSPSYVDLLSCLQFAKAIRESNKK